MSSPTHRLIVLTMVLALAHVAGAQSLPTGPIRAMDGQLLVNGEAAATYSASDEVAYFNYTDYEHNALRMLRVSLAGAWQPLRRIAFVGEVRSEDLDRPHAYAAYVRVRPWLDHEFDIQAGRIPPSFGAFSRRAYSLDNPVIGYPLAYQYLTSIHPDAVPATGEDLAKMRARGWLSTFPVGNTTPSPGVPMVTAFRWDTGFQLHWHTGIVDATTSLTSGTLSDPRASDNNGSPQVSGRIALEPVVGLVVGASGAHGPWLASDVRNFLPAAASNVGFTQTAYGADAEYSRDHWLVRSEMIWSRWRIPIVATMPAGADLDTLAVWVEGRYKVTPRITAGLRLDRMGFSDIPGMTPALPWDGAMKRAEASIGYAIQRNLTARIGVQRNDREAGRVRSRTYLAAQLAYWF